MTTLQTAPAEPAAPAAGSPTADSPVLAAAIAAFAEHGYHGATVRDIAGRAGLSVPGMYHHFASKQEMLRALVEESMADILGRSRAALAAAGDDPVVRFTALVRTVVTFMAQHRELAVLQAESRYLDPDNWRRYVALRDEQESLVAAAVADGKEVGAFATTESAEDATRAVLTLCLGVPGWYRPDGPLGPDQLADQYARFCLGIVGWHADTPATAPAAPADRTGTPPTSSRTTAPRTPHRKERP